MATGLLLRVSIGDVTSERAFPRLPITVGRDPNAAQFVIRDQTVSDLHACIDVLEGRIGVRDIGTPSGTFVAGRRLPPNCWIRPAAAGESVTLQIGGHTIQASTYEMEESPESSSLAELAMSTAGHSSSLTGTASVEAVPQAHTVAPPTFRMQGPVGRLTSQYSDARASMEAFRVALASELEGTPSTARISVCAAMIQNNPDLAEEGPLRAVLEHYGWARERPRSPEALPRPPEVAARVAEPASAPPMSASPLAESALAALQDLVGWYLGRERRMTTTSELASFKESLRGVLDEFFLGYPALVESMSRFEQQIAIRSDQESAMVPPARLAILLLDWANDTKSFRQRVRTGFVELKTYQAALLNGVMGGVKALLMELSPAHIEQTAASARQGLFNRQDPWEVYKKRHRDLADEEGERFRVLFGQEFVDEYRQLAHRDKPPSQT
jgi:predicted component of type VI protein secretion system